MQLVAIRVNGIAVAWILIGVGEKHQAHRVRIQNYKDQ